MGRPPVESAGIGVIVLAAYRPDPTLFRLQLQSIRDQTWSQYRCLIGADSGQAEVRTLVADIVEDDDRFEVVGWDDNLGFYLNFERLLRLVPADTPWVALSDQDDRWNHNKLELLVPELRDAVLVTGQARVVRWPRYEILLERTRRRVAPPEDLLFENQVTGSLSVFRRELLDVALPFPRLFTVTQLHDHWLAVCATTVDRIAIRDDVVQDYIQHDGNLVGEVAEHRTWTPSRIVRRIIELGDTYEGGHSLTQLARAVQVQSYGWRRLMLGTLEARVEQLPPGLIAARDGFALPGPRRKALTLLWHAVRSPYVSLWVVATFLPGIPYELAVRRTAGREAASRRAARR